MFSVSGVWQHTQRQHTHNRPYVYRIAQWCKQKVCSFLTSVNPIYLTIYFPTHIVPHFTCSHHHHYRCHHHTSKKNNIIDNNKSKVRSTGSCNNNKNSTKVRYLHIVISAARSNFKIESGEVECDPVVFWHTDDVNTAQSVGVVAGKVGGLYDARQWCEQSLSTPCEVVTETVQSDVIYRPMNINSLYLAISQLIK